MNNADKISIIVPVYKTARYLSTCIESILKQDYKNFEVLLIDDGSPDESPDICDRYAKQDARIKVVHKKNGGVSAARNTGLDMATGQYIVFIDSDDYVQKEYLSQLFSGLRESRVEDEKVLIIADYQPFSEDGNEERNYPQSFLTENIMTGMTAEQFRNLVFEFRIFPPYCKLYRRDIIEEHHLRFNTEIRTAEDFDFNIRYIKYVDYIYYHASTQYMYRVGYKKYVPSNRGVLGNSEVKSVHIMANGIVNLAKRVGVYEELYDEICLWAAKKHYFNRMPMLFVENKEVGIRERKQWYNQLINDDIYYALYKRGILFAEKSTTKMIGKTFDCFTSWLIFYGLQKIIHK